jgi:4-amino-4-deoxy-L-arabinose transferase-like glycosyltransferase
MNKVITHRLLILSVLLVQLMLGWVFSVIQPLGRTPDETAHTQYIAYLAQTGQLPIFHPQGGGIAGYEAQHPPLYYALGAVIYRLSDGVDEATRWHLLRWTTLLFVGIGVFFASRNFFQTLWPQSPNRVLAATASVVWMPLSLLYASYINPDGLIALWSALVLWFCAKAIRSEFTNRDAALLGLWCALALLTKLSGFPTLLIAIWALWQSPQTDKVRKIAICLGVTSLLTVPWYARNLFLYGSPFIHTNGKYGTGLQNAIADSFVTFGWLTWRETFLSTWVQRGWFPDGFWTWLLYGIVIVSVIGCIVLLALKRKNTGFPAYEATVLKLCALFILLIFLGQQWAFWTVDVEFNAGGRYLLAGLPAIIALLFAGWGNNKLGKIWTASWLTALLVMNLVSAQNIMNVLNPKYAPNWKMFNFPAGEEPQFKFHVKP